MIFSLEVYNNNTIEWLVFGHQLIKRESTGLVDEVEPIILPIYALLQSIPLYFFEFSWTISD